MVRAPVLSVSAASRFFIFLLYFSVELLFAHSSVQFVGLVRSGPITERVLVFSVGVDCVFFSVDVAGPCFAAGCVPGPGSRPSLHVWSVAADLDLGRTFLVLVLDWLLMVQAMLCSPANVI